jgi:hypothetical protein
VTVDDAGGRAEIAVPERLDGLLTAAGYPHTGWPFISFSLTPILQAAQEEFTRALTSAVQEHGKGDKAYRAAYSSDGLARLAASLLACISYRRRNSKCLKMWSRLVGTKNPPHCLTTSMLSPSCGASGGPVRGVTGTVRR